MDAKTSFDRPLHERLQRFANATFLSFAKVGEDVSIWTADNRGMQFHAASVSFNEFRTLSEELLHLLKKPTGNPTWIAALSKKIYEALFSPISSLLRRDRRLFVHFSSEISGIPLAALQSSQGEYLLDKVSFLTTADFPFKPVPPEAHSVSPDAKLLIWNAPLLDNREALDAGIEPDESLCFIASVMPFNDMLTGTSATPHQFLRLAPQANVLHCRTAVTTDEDGPAMHFSAERKALRRAPSTSDNDGRVRLSALSHGMFKNCELLFLDAEYLQRRKKDSAELWRQTSRALHFAGVRSVVLPLWNTTPEARAEFAKAFYANLKMGLSVEESVRRSAQKLRSCPAFSHPHYWANFYQSTTHG